MQNNHDSINKKNTIFFTGGSGFVGSHIAVEMLKKGYNIIFLVRSNKLSSFERIEKILNWHQYEFDKSQFSVIDGDISLPKFGLSEGTYSELPGSFNEVWHCASETSFQDKDHSILEKVNIDGTKNVLNFAKESNCKLFNYMSTSYVFGKKKGICYEEIIEQDSFYNSYEETKYTTEKILYNECEANNIILNIFRPSIIIGDSTTGRTLLFNAFYYPIKVIKYLKDICILDKEKYNGVNAEKMGVHFEDGGNVHIPLRIITGNSLESAINLVPIDFVVKSCIEISRVTTSGGIYHITHKTPIKLQTTNKFCEDYMGVFGLTTALKESLLENPENVLEKQFNLYVLKYLSYMQEERIFDTSNVESVLKNSGIECPEIDHNILCKCMDYATDMEWKNPLLKM